MTTARHRTLKQNLASLTEQHYFSEVLDRLSEIADSNSQAADTEEAAHEWQLVARLLESATLQVKRLETRPDSV